MKKGLCWRRFSRMLKLLLNHWQVHREPAPFILTDDPLYCAHLSTITSKLPEVYSVNRVNPIFEEDEGDIDIKYNPHNRTLSENETRSSDDTGYTSGPRKNPRRLAEDACSYDQHMSTDSDEPSKSVTVSADVHRVSHPDDVIVLSRNSSCSYCASSLSINSSESSQEPYDSLTASNLTPPSSRNPSIEESMKIGGKDVLQTEVKKPSSNAGLPAREKLEKLLQHGNQSVAESSESKESSSKTTNEKEFEDTRAALMKSLTRALNHKVPKTESVSTSSGTADSVTRSDSSKKEKVRTSKEEENSGRQHKAHHHAPTQQAQTSPPSSAGEAVTRQDESISSHASSANSRKRQHRGHNNRHKHHDDLHKPMTLHQLLPGHWSYDNIYLPQMPGVCYHCVHHGHRHSHHGGQYPLVPPPNMEMFYPMFYHESRSRHSWAPRSTPPRTNINSEQHGSASSKEGSSSGRRYSPDGSSRETESDSQREHQQHKLRQDVHERRSLRVPKKCKCDFCLASAFDSSASENRMDSHLPALPPPCTCCYYSHRKVKFASDTDLSRHLEHSSSEKAHKEDGQKPSDKANGTFHINLHRLNGHVNEKSMAMNEDGTRNKLIHSSTPRGQKEPIKMEDVYRSYPINFKEWEAHYKKRFLHKRRKRALNMIGMAIGIILVVGVAIAITFIFLRMKRPAS